MTPSEFAGVARRAIDIRESSYIPQHGAYALDKYQSMKQAMSECLVPDVWFWPLVLFIFEGYVEADQWIEENSQ